MLRFTREKPPLVKCTFCGIVARAKIQWRGSKSVARFLWLTLLFPGPLYNYWQWQGRKQVCSYCGSEHIKPADTAETLDRYEKLKALEKSEKF